MSVKTYQKNYQKQTEYLESYYQKLVYQIKQKELIGITNEWIVDNYYMIVEKKQDLKGFFKRKKNYENAFFKPDLYPIIKKEFEKEHCRFQLDDMAKYLNKYQREENTYFSYDKLSTFRQVTFLIILEKLTEVCQQEETRKEEKEKAEHLFDQIEETNKCYLLTKDLLTSSCFLEHFYNLVRENGQKSLPILEYLNKLLKEENINLNEQMETYYEDLGKTSILISNIFYSIQQLSKIKNETLYAKISFTEKLLWKDKTYKIMSDESKEYYREEIKKNAKKKKMSELEFVENLMQKKAEEEHIGFLLFPPKNIKRRNVLYLSFITITTCLLSALLAPYLIRPVILSFLCLLIPVSELVIQLTNKIILKFFPPHPLAKIDFKDKIKDEYRTMIVIVTILKDKKKVQKMFRDLEAHYLLSPKENVFFTLLGDATSYKEEHYPLDQEIIEEGLKCCETLNKKYKGEIFHFVYRKRKYSKGEETYLGWERKRGALQDLNQLILGQLTKEEQEDYFQANTIKEDLKIKYVMPLDADTKLGLGSISRLIGTMAHPMNQPVLNKERTKVIRGYGMMQPKVTFDLSLENQSTYSQTFAGLGGYDVYSSVVPDFYQDVFQESNFYGKGIYDLAVFNEVILNNHFPKNRILSHDLLEGSYTRCGYVSDVDFYDDFPSDFLVDSKRQHRWARGDMQILAWAFKKNPLNAIHRFKFIDNIRRGLLPFFLLLIIIFAYAISPTAPHYWILFVILILLIPIFFFIFEKIKSQNKRSTKTKQYQNTIVGLQSIILKIVADFSSLPYHARLYLDAFTRALYRMTISKKKLLSWITSEEAAKNTSNTLDTYLIKFQSNYWFCLILILLVLWLNPINIFAVLMISIVFLASPLYFYLMGQPVTERTILLSKKQQEDLFDLAKKTWRYFDQALTPENHYLIPDNYQKNREEVYDIKTSATDISFSILSVISAYKLQIISKKRAFFLLDNILTTIEELKKWNGHLYNWYNIKTKEPMFPYYVSTIDSGNLIASLIVLKELYHDEQEEAFVKRCELLIQKADFKKLFSKETNTFAVGYDSLEEKKSPFHYDKFASESRLTSYIAIAKGDVSYKHWFALDKSLTKFHQYKGLLSWSGTTFEYYMPLLFMNDYPNTLIDESYFFAMYCQKEYQKETYPNLPWGVSEAAYNVLDNAKNYKYKAFGTPYLKFQSIDTDRKVISPYASLIALTKNPEEVYKNYQRWKKINMVGEFGCYESYDIDDKEIIYAYFAHHQGMILTSLANYLGNHTIQKYFQQDIEIEAFDILNKEKLQIKPMIDMKIRRYKAQEYLKEPLENDVRVYREIQQYPEVSALSNARYMILMNERGNGFSRYKDIQLNRYRKISEQDYGCYLYIKEGDHIWSNTYAPVNQKPDRYEVTFALDRLKYQRLDHDIVTNTEIIVTQKHNAEVRKITFKNLGEETHTLELTTYLEPIVCNNKNDISHRVFNSMFLSSEYEENKNALIFERKERDKNNYYFVHKLWSKEFMQVNTYETERSNFLNRNDTYANPAGLKKDLTNYTGDNLDPIASLRNTLTLEGGAKKTVYILNGFGTSKQQILEILEDLEQEEDIKEAFQLVTLTTDKMMKQLNVTSEDVNRYNKALNYLYQTTKVSMTEERRKYLTQNHLSQQNLWRFGISGDIPIILVEIDDLTSLGLTKELLTMFEYYKNRGIYVDMILLNSKNEEQAATIKEVIQNELFYIYSYQDPASYKGTIKVIEDNEITEEEKNLLRGIARLYFDTKKNHSLKDYIDSFQLQNKAKVETEQEKRIPLPLKREELMFDNGFGGFRKEGKEYVIYNRNTPMPWTNVLANEDFGTILTNTNNGFTYAFNSKEYKLTVWTNDTMLDDPSEGFYYNKARLDFTQCTHGFGYSIFELKTQENYFKNTIFVPKKGKVKVNLLTITFNEDQEFELTYFMNPVLGESEDTTIRHLITTFDQNQNALLIQNGYAKQFRDNIVYLTSSEEITSHIDQPVQKGITIKVKGKAKEQKMIAFFLGCKTQAEPFLFTSVEEAKKEEKETKEYWKKELSKIQVQTEDESFNYIMNGWYLYQTLACRILARSAFYQVGGAFGFRDQLQDCMNIATTHEEWTKKQILNCAMHQFKEGDVLHWWHETSRFGLRSRFKDDYLWLVYATYEYLEKTNDTTILEEQIPFVIGQELGENEEERGMTYYYSEEKYPLKEHLKIIMEKTKHEMGNNGLPLMGGGDWNDGMNHIGIKGKGTSIWLGFFLYEVLNRYIKICQKTKIDEIESYQKQQQDLKEALLKNGWDETYYLRAIADDGTKIGSKESKECQIDLISQSFAILTDIATKEQEKTILQAVKEKLVDTKHGLVKLLTPPFTQNWHDIGYIQNYPKGIRENGGQYTHAVAWYIMALSHLKKTQEAYQIFSMLNPIAHAQTEEDCQIYQVEPYVISADIYTHKIFYGKGGWTWYTGSSAWFYKVGLEELLGFQKEGDSLKITPHKIPFDHYQLTYHYQDTLYQIEFKKDKQEVITLDQKEIKGKIPLTNDKKEHTIVIKGGKE